MNMNVGSLKELYKKSKTDESYRRILENELYNMMPDLLLILETKKPDIITLLNTYYNNA
jgi:hypothetical protein